MALPTTSLPTASLPTEVWFQILLQRRPDEVLRLCRTNQIFQSICRDRNFWKQSLQRYLDLDGFIYDLFFTYPLYQNVSGNIIARNLILAINGQDNLRLLRWAILSNFTSLVDYLHRESPHITMKQIITLSLQYNRPQVVADLIPSALRNQLPEYITLAIRARNLPILDILMQEEQESGQSQQDVIDYLEIASEELSYLENNPRLANQEGSLNEIRAIIEYLRDQLVSLT